jgi:hypothetical protein
MVLLSVCTDSRISNSLNNSFLGEIYLPFTRK